jgi:hypothetical protein
MVLHGCLLIDEKSYEGETVDCYEEMLVKLILIMFRTFHNNTGGEKCCLFWWFSRVQLSYLLGI